MEGDLIKINEALLPLSWLYGAGVQLRNMLFDMNVLHSQSYPIPIINVGNITVGGTGKTPHTEYILSILLKNFRVAVLSRGYKRHSKGYVLADEDTPLEMIGDEPWQMKHKFPQAYVAVDSNRRRGIERLTHDAETRDVQVILLDDAYQHRYVKPGMNILLVDYHRMITDDKLLPAGRLREPASSMNRASMVLVTKCPHDITPMGRRVVIKALNLRPFQELYFSTFRYGKLQALFREDERTLESLDHDMHVLLLSGIASPEQMMMDMHRYVHRITPLSYPDHHYFTQRDADNIDQALRALSKPRIIITTEKDAARLQHLEGLSEEVKKSLYVLPVQVEIMKNEAETFNEKITSYVLTDTRNRVLAAGQNEA